MACPLGTTVSLSLHILTLIHVMKVRKSMCFPRPLLNHLVFSLLLGRMQVIKSIPRTVIRPLFLRVQTVGLGTRLSTASNFQRKEHKYSPSLKWKLHAAIRLPSVLNWTMKMTSFLFHCCRLVSVIQLLRAFK
jgi:hypothetical protein